METAGHTTAFSAAPVALGRGLVLAPDAEIPPHWAAAVEVEVGPAELADPRPTADALHARWLARRPVVVRLGVPLAALKEPQIDERPLWEVGAGAELSRERLHFLVWANAYDGRQIGDRGLVWPHAVAAARAVAGIEVAGPADVRLPTGQPAWVDGGPRQPFTGDQTDGIGVLHRDTYECGRADPGRYRAPRADLAADQLAAVAHASGPARIIAPAGSGKTRVLTERLRHLLADRGYERQTVLTLAYNVKAKDELVARTLDIAPRVMTLNGCALAICQAASSQRRTVDEREVRGLLEPLLPTQRHAPNTDPMAPYLDALSRTRLGLLDPVDVEESDGDLDGFADAFLRYRAVLADRNLLDFDEQITVALEVMLRHPEIRRRFQAGARHLLVDEFQDLTPAHLLLVRLLSAPAYEVFGVGDDDQVIYGYAGADPRFLVDYDSWFPGAHHHALHVNYRCPPMVVRSASRLLTYSTTRVSKDIESAPGRAEVTGEFEVALVARADEGPIAVARVTAWLDAGVASGEIAVLARVNSALLPAQVMLAEAALAAAGPLTERVLQRTGMAAALAYLRIGLDPGRITRADVDATVRRPSRKIAPKVLDMIKKRPTTSLVELGRLAEYLDRDGPKVAGYRADLETIAGAVSRGRDTAAILGLIREQVGLGTAMDTLDGAGAAKTAAAHGDDLLALEQVATVHPDPATFEAWLREILSRPPDPSGVTLSTIHRVKGREWDRVVVLGASGGLFPHRLAEDLEEERRIFHVGITRGRAQIVVVGDKDDPSPFLAEAAGTASHDRPLRRTGVTAGRGALVPPRPGSGRSSKTGAEAKAERLAVIWEPHQEVALAALRAWRIGKARSTGAPAFTVFNDATLHAIVAAWPTSLNALSWISGVGPAKLERHGDEVLAVLDGVTVPIGQRGSPAHGPMPPAVSP